MKTCLLFVIFFSMQSVDSIGGLFYATKIDGKLKQKRMGEGIPLLM